MPEPLEAPSLQHSCPLGDKAVSKLHWAAQTIGLGAPGGTLTTELGAGSAPRPTGSSQEEKDPKWLQWPRGDSGGRGVGPGAGTLTLRVTTPNCTLQRWHSSASTQSGAWGRGDRQTQDRTGPRPGQDPIVGSGAEGPVCEAGAHPKRALLCTGVSADSLRLGGSIRLSHTSPPGELRSKRSPRRRGCPAHASFLRQNGSSATDVPPHKLGPRDLTSASLKQPDPWGAWLA